MEELLYKYKIYFPLSCGISLRDIVQQERTSVSVFIKTVIQAFYCLKMLHRLGYRLGLTTTILDGFIGNASDPSLKGFYIYMTDLSECECSSSDEDKQKDFDELLNEISKIVRLRSPPSEVRLRSPNVGTDSDIYLECSHVLNYIYDRFSSNITSNKVPSVGVHPLTRRVDREVQLVKEERSQLRVDESKEVERIEQPKVKENNIQLLKQQKLEQVERDNKKRINDALEQKNRRENAKQEEIKRQQEENERRAEMERQQAIQLQHVEIARQAELDEQEESHLRIMIQEARNTIDRLGDIQPIYNQLVERYRNNPLLYSIMEEEWKEVVIREKAMVSELSFMNEQIELALQLIKKPSEETDHQLDEIILGLRTRYGRNPVLLDRLNERWEDVVEKKKQMDVVYSQIQGVIQQAYQQVDQLGDPKPILSFLSKKYEGADINLSNYILQESENVIKYKNEMDQNISIIRKAVEEAIGVLKKGDTLATGGMDKVKQIIRGVRDRFMGNPLLQDLISTGFQEVEEEQRRLEEEHRQKLLLIQQAKEEEDARFQRLAAEKENTKPVERVGLVGSYVYEDINREETKKEKENRERDERQRMRALIGQQRKEERERIKQMEEDRKKLEQEQIRIQTVKLLQEQAEEDVRKKQLEVENAKKAEEYLARQSREQQRKQEEVERKEKLKAEEEAHRKQREENTRKQKEALKEQEKQLKIQAEEREKQRVESIRIREEAREKERSLLEEEKKKKEEIHLEQARVFKEEQDKIEAERALREAKRREEKAKKIQLLKQEKLDQEERINKEKIKKALEQIEKDKVARAEELRIKQKEVEDARLINEELERQAEIDRVEKLRLEASDRLKRLEEDEKKLKLFIDGELLKITKVEDYQVLLKEIVDYGDEVFVSKYYSQIEQQRRNDQNWIEKLGRSDFDYPSYAYFYDSNRVPSYIRNMFLKQWKEYKEIKQQRIDMENVEKENQLRVEEEALREHENEEELALAKGKQEELRKQQALIDRQNYKKTIRQVVVNPETVEEKEQKQKAVKNALIDKQLSEFERIKDYATVIPKILQLYKNNPEHPSVKKYIDDLYKKIKEKLEIQDQLCVQYKYNKKYLEEYNKLLKMLDVLNVSGDPDRKVMIDKERLINNCMEIITIIRTYGSRVEDLNTIVDYRFFEQYQTELEKIIEYEKFDNELSNLYMKFATRDLPTMKQLAIFKKLFASVLSDDDRNLETVEDVYLDQIRKDVAKIRRVELDRNEFIRSLVGQLSTIMGKTTTLQYNGGMNDPLLRNVKYVSDLLSRFLNILREHVDEADVVFRDFKEAVNNDPKLSPSIKSRLDEIIQYSVDLIAEDYMVEVVDD